MRRRPAAKSGGTNFTDQALKKIDRSSVGELGQDVTEWTKTVFSVNDPTSVLQGRLATDPSETGYRVIYVKKDGPQRFWQLKVE